MSIEPSTRAESPGAAPGARAPRNRLLDGLRGIAIVLVVLAHTGIVWPDLVRPELGPAEGLLQAGNIGVSVFFVLGAFLVTRGLLRARETGPWTAPVARLARRTVRISLQVYVVLAAVALIAALDPRDKSTDDATFQSLRAVATYTWNTYVAENPLNARSDLGALYYLSIELQYYVVLLVVVALLWRWRTALIALTIAAILVVTWWRWHAYEIYGWYRSMLMTTVRSDALLYGTLAALVVDRVRVDRARARALLGSAVLVITGTVVSCSFGGVALYFGVQGAAIAFATALFALAAVAGDDGSESYATRALSSAPLVWLGSASLTIFLWHIPIFSLVARHTPTWSPDERTAVAFVALAVVVALVQRYVASPVTTWVGRLGSPRDRGASGRHRRPSA